MAMPPQSETKVASFSYWARRSARASAWAWNSGEAQGAVVKQENLGSARQNSGQGLIQVERGRGAVRIEPATAGFGSAHVESQR